MSLYNPLNWLHRMWQWWCGKWDLPSLQDQVDNEREIAMREKMEAQEMLRKGEFLLLYAEAKLAALDSWQVKKGREASV